MTVVLVENKELTRVSDRARLENVESLLQNSTFLNSE